MPRPFRFGVVSAHAPSRAAWVAMARRAEELGYARARAEPKGPGYGKAGGGAGPNLFS